MKRNNIYISFFKPTLDFLSAIIFIALFLPLMLIIYLLILLTTGNNPIFSQERYGIHGKTIHVYKFRTLRSSAPDYIKTESFVNMDEYYLWCGKFLRLSHIDELPQLFNILFFQMSFVGPRPHIEQHKKLLKLREDQNITSLRPGITGLAQISAKDHPFSDEEKAEYDLIYFDNISFIYDIKIIFKTLGFVFDMIKVAIRNRRGTTNGK